MSRPGWFRDPSSRFHYRWWDGELWTRHVSVNGVASVDPAGAAVVDPSEPPGDTVTPPPPTAPAAHNVGAGGDTRLFLTPYLRFDEIRKGFVGTSYQISSPKDGPLGQVVRHGSILSGHFRLLDLHQQPVLTMTPSHAGFNKRYVITDPAGTALGHFVSRSSVGGSIRLEMMTNQQSLGVLRANSWTNSNFRLTDGRQSIIADIERPKSGVADYFSGLDRYKLTRYSPVSGVLQWLTLIAPVVIDRVIAARSNGM